MNVLPLALEPGLSNQQSNLAKQRMFSWHCNDWKQIHIMHITVGKLQLDSSS